MTAELQKKQLREHLASIYTEQDMLKWFSPLDFCFSLGEGSLTVIFPHIYFGRWFLEEIHTEFAEHVEHLFPGTTVRYTLKNGGHTFLLPSNGKEATKTVVPAPWPEHTPGFKTKCMPQIPLPDNIFPAFLVNKKNDCPLAAAKDMTAHIHTPIYTPFIIYGQSGSGKTHLMEAIINVFLQKTSPHCCFYGCVEEFFEEARVGAQKNQLLYKYHAFFIDDAQRIMENAASQRIFTTALDTLLRANRPVTLTLDAHPDSYTDIQVKLRSRLTSGLVVELKKPDIDIRRQYVQQMNTEFSLGLEKNDILTIAQRYLDFRTITGVLTRIKAYKLLVDQGSLDLTNIIGRQNEQKLLTPAVIVATVAEFTSTTPELILGKSRNKDAVMARQMAMYLCRDLLGLSLAQVGSFFMGRDHSSVLYAIKKIKEIQDSDKVTNNTLSQLKNLCLSETYV